MKTRSTKVIINTTTTVFVSISESTQCKYIHCIVLQQTQSSSNKLRNLIIKVVFRHRLYLISTVMTFVLSLLYTVMSYVRFITLHFLQVVYKESQRVDIIKCKVMKYPIHKNILFKKNHLLSSNV